TFFLVLFEEVRASYLVCVLNLFMPFIFRYAFGIEGQICPRHAPQYLFFRKPEILHHAAGDCPGVEVSVVSSIPAIISGLSRPVPFIKAVELTKDCMFSCWMMIENTFLRSSASK